MPRAVLSKSLSSTGVIEWRGGMGIKLCPCSPLSSPETQSDRVDFGHGAFFECSNRPLHLALHPTVNKTDRPYSRFKTTVAKSLGKLHVTRHHETSNLLKRTEKNRARIAISKTCP